MLRSKASRKSAPVGMLRAGMRFFAAPHQIGSSTWLQLHLQGSAVGTCAVATTGNVASSNRVFVSDDVALNIYTPSAPLPSFSSAEDGSGGLLNVAWVQEDEQYIRRLRSAEGPQSAASELSMESCSCAEGIVSGMSSLKVAQRELISPTRLVSTAQGLGYYQNSSMKPSRATARKTWLADVNFQRHSILDPRLALEVSRF